MKIKRARGHRLYTNDSKKILDLSMDWGRAVIGHRPNGLSLTIKNIIDRGLYSAYDSVDKARLTKYLLKMFPEYKYVNYLEYENKIKDYIQEEISDPLFSETDGNKISYWRPFLPVPESEYLIILYPLPGLNSTTLLLSKNDLKIVDDLISPILFAGILRSLYDYDMILKEFKIDNYQQYKMIPCSRFLPPYVTFDLDPKKYKSLVEYGKNNDILLNEKKQFIVLPPDFSDGEIKKVLSIFL